MTQNAAAKRALLASIAYKEGLKARQGNEQKAGIEIEPYLSVFREAFNKIDRTTKYSDKTIGFDWCCAFVYYCCLQADCSPPIQPIPARRATLGFVSLWYDWANLPENQFYFSADRSDFEPKPGDIVLFDHLLEPVPLDHIGMIVEVRSSELVTAEGNVNNRSGIFHRPFDRHINGYIRLA